jgi:hypothetical protein
MQFARVEAAVDAAPLRDHLSSRPFGVHFHAAGYAST